MAHHCKTLIIHCIDFRLQKATKEYLDKEGLLADCDILSVAGAIKPLLSPKNPSDREFMLDQINTSVALHEIKEIIISNHTDCGAYKGAVIFGSFKEECKFHISEMEKAGEIILSKFPGLKIRMLLGKIMPDGTVNLEEIQ
jgi:carbonic anhydrase